MRIIIESFLKRRTWILCKKCLLLAFSIRIERLKPKDFWEVYSAEITDDDFRQYYRMDRGTFEALKMFLNPSVHMYQGGRKQISPHKMLGMTLFFLSLKLPYFQMSGIFGMSSECFIWSTNYIIQLLNKKCPDVIKWPQKEDYKKISENFNESGKRQFLNVIGAIDGCHI